MNDETQPDPNCGRCGRPRSAHGIDPATGDATECPVLRQEDPAPPRGDY